MNLLFFFFDEGASCGEKQNGADSFPRRASSATICYLHLTIQKILYERAEERSPHNYFIVFSRKGDTANDHTYVETQLYCTKVYRALKGSLCPRFSRPLSGIFLITGERLTRTHTLSKVHVSFVIAFTVWDPARWYLSSKSLRSKNFVEKYELQELRCGIIYVCRAIFSFWFLV